ncbi:hypothetical protein Tco_1232913 [Tanacetum coccineum]
MWRYPSTASFLEGLWPFRPWKFEAITEPGEHRVLEQQVAPEAFGRGHTLEKRPTSREGAGGRRALGVGEGEETERKDWDEKIRHYFPRWNHPMDEMTMDDLEWRRRRS